MKRRLLIDSTVLEFLGRLRKRDREFLLARFEDHPIPVVDQLLDLNLPLLERKCPEPVLIKEGSHLLLTAEGADTRNSGPGGVKRKLEMLKKEGKGS